MQGEHQALKALDRWKISTVQSAVSSLFYWVGTLSKIIKVYHNKNFLFSCIFLYS